jgi:alkylhydroperoxidase family enzyme
MRSGCASKPFGEALRRGIDPCQRLVELIRVRIALHNRCRPCMSMLYGTAVDEAVTESLACP